MSVSNPIKEKNNATKTSQRKNSIPHARSALCRWTSVRINDRNVFDEYINSPTFRKIVNSGYYVRVGDRLVIKPIGNHILSQGIDVDEYISKNAVTLGIDSPRDIILHKTYTHRSSVGGFHSRGGMRPGWKAHHAHRKPATIKDVRLNDAYKTKNIKELSKNEFLCIVGGTGGQEPPNNFKQLLEFFLQRGGITIEYLSELTGIPDRTIRRIKNEPNRRPTLEHLVAICIALHLMPSESEKLISFAGYVFKETSKERALQYLVDCAYDQTVADCNMFLTRMGFEALTEL